VLIALRNRRRDGEYRHILSLAVPVKDAGGTVVKWIGTTTDVHDAWLAQEQLRELNANLERRVVERSEALLEQEERFRSAFDFAAIGMALVGLDGKWLKVNRALCEMVGRSEEELLVADSQSITHPDDLDADLACVRQMLDGTLKACQMEKRYFHKSGHVVHAQLNVSLVRGGKGEPLYFVSQIKDVTQRKRVEEQMQASLRDKEVLLREIHHRVKNNLQVISSLLDLQARYVRDPDAVAMFRASQDRVRSMALVHERLYRSAALSSIDFASYLMNLANHLFAAYGVEHDRVKREWSLQPVNLAIDAAVPCGLIVNELICNCLKYAFPGGRAGVLRLRLAQEAGEVILGVIDDGVGLPRELGEDLQGARTFGFRLIGALAAQLHGAVRLSRGTEGGSGTTVEVRFPAGRKLSERRGDA
jgi:PAS domain S-box-containing protein